MADKVIVTALDQNGEAIPESMSRGGIMLNYHFNHRFAIRFRPTERLEQPALCTAKIYYDGRRYDLTTDTGKEPNEVVQGYLIPKEQDVVVDRWGIAGSGLRFGVFPFHSFMFGPEMARLRVRVYLPPASIVADVAPGSIIPINRTLITSGELKPVETIWVNWVILD